MELPRRAGAEGTGRRPWAAIVAGLVVLTVLGAGVVADFGPQLRLDAAVSRALYAGDDRSAARDVLLEVLTAPGLTAFRMVVFLPVLGWLGARRAWWTAAWVITAIVAISPITELLKNLVGRVRPAFEGGGAGYGSLSYPSGHSSGVATLVTVALVLAWPRLSRRGRHLAVLGGAALALLVGLTRLWLGVHFLSDVLGGWSLGVAWSLTVAWAFGGLPGGRAALRPVRQEVS